MPRLKALHLEGRLAEAAGAPFCALVGRDEGVRSHCLRLLKAAAAPADLPGTTVRQFEDVPEVHEVLDELRTVPFMGLEGRRVVIVEKGDAFLAAHWEALAGYVRKPSPTSALLLCVDELDPGKPPGARKKAGGAQRAKGKAKPAAAERGEGGAKAWPAFVEVLGAEGFIVECSAPSWSDAKSWLRAQAERMGKKLTPRAVDSLLDALGPNVVALQNELAKLCAYSGAEVTVAERDVEEIVAEARTRSVFDLAGAVSRSDVPEALRLCHGLLLRGEKTEHIVSVLAFQLRQLWQVKRLRAAGLSETEIVRAMRVQPFVVTRAMNVVSALSEKRLARQFQILSAADVESKVTSLRSQEETVWVENLVARLCAP
jgi:hypothetical protein